jgi:hypothetical protein
MIVNTEMMIDEYWEKLVFKEEDNVINLTLNFKL